jgi:hypothetical protein
MRKLFEHKGFLALRAPPQRCFALGSGVVFEEISPPPGWSLDLSLH